MADFFKSRDVTRITGLAPQAVNEWCELGYIPTVAGGSGHGDHRVYSRMTMVGLAVMTALRNSDRGCVRAYAAKVIHAFAQTPEKTLLRRFEQGATHFIMVHQDKPILGGADYPDRVDVQKLYKQLCGA